MASNSDNNPYVQSGNQTVVDNIMATFENISNFNLTGDASSKLSFEQLVMAGATTTSATEYTAAQLDDILSGSPIGRFNSSDRNSGSSVNSNPDKKVGESQKDNITGQINYPDETAPYCMSFQFFKYKRPSQFGTTKFDPIGKTITLPLPDGDGIKDNSDANWTESSLGLVGNALDSIKNADQIAKAASKDGGLTTFGNLAVEAGIVAGTRYAAAFAQEIKIPGGLGDVGGAIESQLGAVENPGMAQLFKGVHMRQFSFNWTLAPKNETESRTVKEIIDIFKKNHLPTFMAGGSSFMFNYPNIVRPSFITPAGSNPDEAGFMTTFEYCAITSVHVNYSPQGAAPAFYAKSSAPVFIQLQINLQELNIRLGDRYGGELTGAGGLDLLADQFKQLATGATNLFTEAAAKTNPIADGSGETANPPKVNP